MVQFGELILQKASESATSVQPDKYMDYDKLKQIIDIYKGKERAQVTGDEFFAAVDAELLKVTSFLHEVSTPKKELMACPLGPETTCHCVVTRKPRPSSEMAIALQDYAKLNREGFRKIMKKWRKNFKGTVGSEEKDLDVRLQVIYWALKDPVDEMESVFLINNGEAIKTGSSEKKVLLLIVVGIAIAVLVISLTEPRITAAFGVGFIFSFLLAIANGANDICNSVGTSVGAGALTMRQAVVWGCLFEFLGAITMGQFVSKEISKGVLVSADYVGPEQDLFALCMMSVLVGASLTTLLATFYGFPISATHGIIGGLVAVGIAAQGVDSIGWSALVKMVVGWVLSPVLAMSVSGLLFLLINKTVIKTANPMSAAKRWQPVFLWMTLSVCSLFLIIKGPKPVKNIWLWAGEWFAVVIACCFGAVVTVCYAFFKPQKVIPLTVSDPELLENGSNKSKKKEEDEELKKVEKLTQHDSDDEDEDDKSHENEESSVHQKEVEELFSPLLVISALCVAFAHGANDVGNAVGPLSVIYQLYKDGSIPEDGRPDIPLWALFAGAVGFVIGIVFLGSRTISTVGTKITKLTPTRSYSTQIGAAIAVLVSSTIGLPVSTSHCLVGSVIGIGLVQKCMGVKGALSLTVLKKIVLGWVVTIPMAMGAAVLVFLPFQSLFS